MSLKIVLMDNSLLTEKTLHYFLQPYTPNIHPFNQKNKFPEEIKTINPDIVFIDSEHIKHQEQITFFQNQNVPLVFLSKENESVSHSFHGELKKPIDPKNLQTLIGSLVPRTQSLKIDSFLEYEPLRFDPSLKNGAENLETENLEKESAENKKKDSPQYFSNPIMINEMIETPPSKNKSSKDKESSNGLLIKDKPGEGDVNSESMSETSQPLSQNLDSETKISEIQKDIKNIIKTQILIQNEIQKSKTQIGSEQNNQTHNSQFQENQTQNQNNLDQDNPDQNNLTQIKQMQKNLEQSNPVQSNPTQNNSTQIKQTPNFQLQESQTQSNPIQNNQMQNSSVQSNPTQNNSTQIKQTPNFQLQESQTQSNPNQNSQSPVQSNQTQNNQIHNNPTQNTQMDSEEKNKDISLFEKISSQTIVEELTSMHPLKNPSVKNPQEPVQKIIESTIEAQIQNTDIKKYIQKNVEDIFIKDIKQTFEKEGLLLIRESIQELLPQFLKELIQTQSFQDEIKDMIYRITVQDLLQSSQNVIQNEIHKSTQTDVFKKLIQDIIWKIVPELSKQMIQKEIDKTNESDS